VSPSKSFAFISATTSTSTRFPRYWFAVQRSWPSCSVWQTRAIQEGPTRYSTYDKPSRRVTLSGYWCSTSVNSRAWMTITDTRAATIYSGGSPQPPWRRVHPMTSRQGL